jgi:thiol-disulfide isomerase/thioredoxin
MRKSSLLVLAVTLLISAAVAQKQEIAWSDAEKPIYEQLHDIRKVPDDKRGQVTKDLALKIRALPSSPNKLRLAVGLASRATEGDFGHENLQEVGSTLARVIKEQTPVSPEPYMELASLVRYEHVDASLDSPQYSAAMTKLEAADQKRQNADFTLSDINGKPWTLKDMKGRVVLLNFWATWCPPCRKEMPDLEALYRRFGPQGLIILGVDDEETDKVKPFVAQQGITYPVLLDPGRKVNTLFEIEGIPKSFVYDRDGKIVAQSIDMRTQKQFLEMLGRAGIN